MNISTYITKNFNRYICFSFMSIISFFLLLSFSSIAIAQTNGNSSSYGAFVDLNFLPLIGSGIDIDLGPLSTASGSATDPNTYSDSDAVASASVSVGGLGDILSTGVLTVNANGDLSNDTTSADSTVNDLGIFVTGALTLLSITADTVQSTADISGVCGDTGLTATGTTTIEGATVGGTLGLGLNINVNPAPNTELLNLLGIRVILNEQIVSGNGTDSLGLTVNAIHVDLSDTILSLIGVLSGDVIISQSQAQVLCDEVAGTSNLSITKTDSPDPVTVGNMLTYTLTVTNNGPDEATGVTVTDTLPGSFTLNMVTPSQGSCNNMGNTVTCDLGSISNGGSATITIDVTPTQGGVIANTAVVSGDQIDPDPSDNSDTQSTTVEDEGPPSANLSISKTGSPNPVIVNQLLTYTVTVTNIGPDNASNVIVTDTLPAGAVFQMATPAQGSCGEAAGVVTCNIGSISAGNSVLIEITVFPTIVGTATNNVSVIGDENDPNPDDNSDDDDTQVDPRSSPTPTPPSTPSPAPPGSPTPTPAGPPMTTSSVPTLSVWGTIVLPLLLVFVAVAVLKRRGLKQ